MGEDDVPQPLVREAREEPRALLVGEMPVIGLPVAGSVPLQVEPLNVSTPAHEVLVNFASVYAARRSKVRASTGL